jgi:hypothetical protein
MFEQVDDANSQGIDLPPLPKILLIDLSLITGMDTSATDIFGDIKKLCITNDCKLFLSGLSQRMRTGLALGGLVADRRRAGSKGMTRFFSDLDTALGKAEDLLVQYEMKDISLPRTMRSGASGFELSLMQIDDMHGEEFAESLLQLEPYVEPLELQPGECLFACDGGVVQERSRGLFFIESGLLKIERDSSHSLTQSRSLSRASSQQFTLTNAHARMGTVAMNASLPKSLFHSGGQQALRLARIGPGW